MADYTYATSSRNVYDELIKAERERANALANAYAEKEKEANAAYATAINNIHANKIAAAEETAAADTAKAQAAYDVQFDANAATELARRRALKEQMASYGLGQSGFNATNQTALSVARNRADAATRTARQQAVDSIDEGLRQYKADAANELAATLANSEREAADRVLKNEQELQSNVHQNALDITSLAVADAKDARENARKSDEQLKTYVEDHNRGIYQNMLDAYDGGNAALAEEYAKQLWQIDENGNVVPMPFDTHGASKFANEQTALEAQRVQAAIRQSETKEETKEVERDLSALGFPTLYDTEIEDVRLTMQALGNVADETVKNTMKMQAMQKLYLIERRASDPNDAAYMDSETFYSLLRYVGVDKATYQAYKAMMESA